LFILFIKCAIVGAIDVQVATVSKQNRQHSVEVYTVAFVPSYLLPDSRPVSLDPFLEPLVRDFEDGFIEGYSYSNIYHCLIRKISNKIWLCAGCTFLLIKIGVYGKVKISCIIDLKDL